MIPYVNKPFSKTRLKQFVSWALLHFGENKTVALVEKLKDLGYAYATRAGISLGIDDLLVPETKALYLKRAETQLKLNEADVNRAHLASIQYFSRVINVWTYTNEVIKNEVIHGFKQSDTLNPVYMMAFSGARGNISQVRQLVGMRGLMADPNGQIIDFAIQSNFREGLSLTEYIIACYGSRKGVVDTALRTATSGYLTRRLVDVAQHVVIVYYDCLSAKGLNLAALTVHGRQLLTLKARLIGRVLSQDIYLDQKCIPRNQELDDVLAGQLAHNVEVPIRSALTCDLKDQVCQLCYGWNLACGRLVRVGETVGVIAAQSIGEPGTQLTMRTFHTGGVFSGDASAAKGEIRCACVGVIDFPTPTTGLCVKTSQGEIAFLTKLATVILVKPSQSRSKAHYIHMPSHSLIFVKQGQTVYPNEILGEVADLNQSANESMETLFSPFNGEVRFETAKSLRPWPEELAPCDQEIRVHEDRARRRAAATVTPIFQRQVKQHQKKNLRISTAHHGRFWLLGLEKQTLWQPCNGFLKPGDRFEAHSAVLAYRHKSTTWPTRLQLNGNQPNFFFLPLFFPFMMLKSHHPVKLQRWIKQQRQRLTQRQTKTKYRVKQFRTSYRPKKPALGREIAQPLRQTVAPVKRFTLNPSPRWSLTSLRMSDQLHATRAEKWLFSLPFHLQACQQFCIPRMKLPKPFVLADLPIYQHNDGPCHRLMLTLLPPACPQRHPLTWSWFNRPWDFREEVVHTNMLYIRPSVVFRISKRDADIAVERKTALEAYRVGQLQKERQEESFELMAIKKAALNQQTKTDHLKAFSHHKRHDHPQRFYYMNAHLPTRNDAHRVFLPRLRTGGYRLLEGTIGFYKLPRIADLVWSFWGLYKTTYWIRTVGVVSPLWWPQESSLTMPYHDSFHLYYYMHWPFDLSQRDTQPSLRFGQIDLENDHKPCPQISQAHRFRDVPHLTVGMLIDNPTPLVKSYPWHAFSQITDRPSYLNLHDPAKLIARLSLNARVSKLSRMKWVNPLKTFLPNSPNPMTWRWASIDHDVETVVKPWIISDRLLYAILAFQQKTGLQSQNQSFARWDRLNLNHVHNDPKVLLFLLLFRLPQTRTPRLTQRRWLSKGPSTLASTIDRVDQPRVVQTHAEIMLPTLARGWVFLSGHSRKPDHALNAWTVYKWPDFNSLQPAQLYFTSPMIKPRFHVWQNFGMVFFKTCPVFHDLLKQRGYPSSMSKSRFSPVLKAKFFLYDNATIRLDFINRDREKPCIQSYLIAKLNTNPRASHHAWTNNQRSLQKRQDKTLTYYHCFFRCLYFQTFRLPTLALPGCSNPCFTPHSQKMYNHPWPRYQPNLNLKPTALNQNLQCLNSRIIKQVKLNTFYLLLNPTKLQRKKSGHVGYRHGQTKAKMKKALKRWAVPKQNAFTFNQINKGTRWNRKEVKKKRPTGLTFPLPRVKMTRAKRANLHKYTHSRTQLRRFLKPIKLVKPMKRAKNGRYFEPFRLKQNGVDQIVKRNRLDQNTFHRLKKTQMINAMSLTPYETQKVNRFVAKVNSLSKLFFKAQLRLDLTKTQVLAKKRKKVYAKAALKVANDSSAFKKLKLSSTNLRLKWFLSTFRGQNQRVLNLKHVLTSKKPRDGSQSLAFKYYDDYLESKSIHNILTHAFSQRLRCTSVDVQRRQNTLRLKCGHFDVWSTKITRTSNRLSQGFFAVLLNDMAYVNVKLGGNGNGNGNGNRNVKPSDLHGLVLKDDHAKKGWTETSAKGLGFAFSNGSARHKQDPLPLAMKRFEHLGQYRLRLPKPYDALGVAYIRAKTATETAHFQGELIASVPSLQRPGLIQPRSYPFVLNSYNQPLTEIYYLNHKNLINYGFAFENATKHSTLGTYVGATTPATQSRQFPRSGQVFFLSKTNVILRRANYFLVPAQSKCYLKPYNFVDQHSPLLTLRYKNLTTGDIVQGIPKIERIFEGRAMGQRMTLPSLVTQTFNAYQPYTAFDADYRNYVLFNVLQEVQRFAIDAIQNVYQSQGVNIADKHLEIIIKQMTTKVVISHPGETGLLFGELVYLDWVEFLHRLPIKKALFVPRVNGITKTSLKAQGFLAPASFQETVRVLSHAAIMQKRDFLKGLKANVILGNVITIGTRAYHPL